MQINYCKLFYASKTVPEIMRQIVAGPKMEAAMLMIWYKM